MRRPRCLESPCASVRTCTAVHSKRANWPIQTSRGLCSRDVNWQGVRTTRCLRPHQRATVTTRRRSGFSLLEARRRPGARHSHLADDRRRDPSLRRELRALPTGLSLRVRIHFRTEDSRARKGTTAVERRRAARARVVDAHWPTSTLEGSRMSVSPSSGIQLSRLRSLTRS